MSNSPGKYGNVREFLDNLGNEKIKICRNCNAVFSYQNESTTLCISCDFEEEISTLPAVVEIEDQFEAIEAEPAFVSAEPTVLEAEPVVAEVDIVESTSDWDMDFSDDIEVESEPVVEEAVEDDFPLALEYEVDNAAADTSLSTSFDTTAETVESLFASRGYSLSFTLVSSTEDSGTYTFVYSFEINDGTMYINLDQTVSF